MPRKTPLPAVVATVVLGIIGVAAIAGAGVIGRAAGGSDSVPAEMLLITLGTLLAFGLLAIAGAVGTWRGTAWGWVAGVVVLVLSVLAAVSATLAGAFEPPLLAPEVWFGMLAGLVLFGLLVVSLAAPSVRSRAGIGGRRS
jgi:hypothetical protein